MPARHAPPEAASPPARSSNGAAHASPVLRTPRVARRVRDVQAVSRSLHATRTIYSPRQHVALVRDRARPAHVLDLRPRPHPVEIPPLTAHITRARRWCVSNVNRRNRYSSHRAHRPRSSPPVRDDALEPRLRGGGREPRRGAGGAGGVV